MGGKGRGELEYEYTAAGVRITLMRGSLPLPPKSTALPRGDLFHTHAWYELFCADRGETVLYFEDERLTLSASHFALISPAVLHYAEGAAAVACSFTVEALEKSDTAVALSSFLRAHGVRTFAADELSVMLYRAAMAALGAGKGAEACSYLVSLLLRASSLSAESELPSLSTSDSEAGRIYKIEQALYSYYSRELPLSYLAEQLHLSERQLSRVFKKQYGIGYREKNRELRMRSAARLLLRGESIATVAREVGYRSESAFYAAFKSFFGISPAAYRADKNKHKK